MSFPELLLIAAGLSMDAFAAAVCKGLALGHANLKASVTVGLYFGFFQAGMPILGSLLGTHFSQTIRQWDHWAAFLLMALIAAGILKEAADKECNPSDASLSAASLTLLAAATSIDALAVGLSFALLQIQILPAAALIGAVTFFLSALGTGAGTLLGARCRRRAQLAGGLLLLLMGLRILLEHL